MTNGTNIKNSTQNRKWINMHWPLNYTIHSRNDLIKNVNDKCMIIKALSLTLTLKTFQFIRNNAKSHDGFFNNSLNDLQFVVVKTT